MGQSRPFIEVTAVVLMFAMTVSMYLVWAVAFVNDGSTAVFIDRYGEQFLELVLWTVVIPIVAVGLHSYFSRRRGDDVGAESSGSSGDS